MKILLGECPVYTESIFARFRLENVCQEYSQIRYFVINLDSDVNFEFIQYLGNSQLISKFWCSEIWIDNISVRRFRRLGLLVKYLLLLISLFLIHKPFSTILTTSSIRADGFLSLTSLTTSSSFL